MEKKTTTLKIPSKFVKLATEWHGGQDSMLYAVSSTGSLSIGNRKPIWANDEESWFLGLLERLTDEVNLVINYLKSHPLYEIHDLPKFQEFLGFLKQYEN